AEAVMGLVIEATRKIESLAIGEVPSTSAEPAAATSTRSPRATRPTAPGTDPLLTWVCRTSCRSLIGPLVPAVRLEGRRPPRRAIIGPARRPALYSRRSP